MKHAILIAFFHYCFFSFCTAQVTTPFNDGWDFVLNDNEVKQTVRLPHDWGVTQPMSPHGGSCQGYLPGGIATYTKHFTPTADWTADGGQVFIYFEGVYNRSTVSLNGHKLGYRPSGFNSFAYNLTPYLQADADNILTVDVDHSRENDSRWYTGSGIYRPVWLVRKPATYIKMWGISWRTPVVNKNKARVEVDVETNQGWNGNVRVSILGQDGKVVATTTHSMKGDTITTAQFTIQQPKLWNLTSPYLYKIETCLMEGSTIIDRSETTLGLRSLEFSPDRGFALNGEWMKVKGVCVHDDAGVLGTAVPPEVWRYRLQQLKRIGVNAIRMSHNPHAPVLYSLCDTLGLLVMDEASDEWEFPKRKWLKGWNQGKPGFDGTYDYFEEWIDRDVADMVRRDRCHPCVFLWSIGNEVDYPNDPYSHPVLDGDKDMTQPVYGGYKPEQPNAERIGKIAMRLAAVVRGIETTRPVTGALAGVVMSNETEYPEAVDVVGYNYTESRYESDHRRYPKRIIYGSENRHDQKAWQAVTDHPYIFGQFLWTGIDYLGESGPWPARGSGAGLLDLTGHIKPGGWQRATMWTDSTNIEQRFDPRRARSGRPYALRATLLNPDSYKGAELQVAIVEIQVVDEDGRQVFQADNQVTCMLPPGYRLLGMENGDLRDTNVRAFSPRCRVYGGRLVAYIQRDSTAQGFSFPSRRSGRNDWRTVEVPTFTAPMLQQATWQ